MLMICSFGGFKIMVLEFVWLFIGKCMYLDLCKYDLKGCFYDIWRLKSGLMV